MITESSKKKPGPKPTGKGQLIGLRLQPTVLAALDAFAVAAEEHGPDPSRPQAIRAILSEWLATHGFLKRVEHDDPVGPATEAVRAMDEAIKEHRTAWKK